MAIDITGGDFMDVPSMAEPLFLFPFTTGQTTAGFLYFATMLAQNMAGVIAFMEAAMYTVYVIIDYVSRNNKFINCLQSLF